MYKFSTTIKQLVMRLYFISETSRMMLTRKVIALAPLHLRNPMRVLSKETFRLKCTYWEPIPKDNWEPIPKDNWEPIPKDNY